MILVPWKDVFTHGSMHTFLVKNIYPKLEAALLHLNINPVNQVPTGFDELIMIYIFTKIGSALTLNRGYR